MNLLLKNLKLSAIVLALFAMFCGALALYIFTPQQLELGGDTVLPIAGQTYYLAGSGVSSADTSLSLTSFTIPQTGQKITDNQMSETFYLTIEPGSRTRQELVSCTTVTQNDDNTATLSGCARGLAPISPYTASTTFAFSHSGGSAVIFSNPPQLYNQAAFKDNDETITGTWLGPTPLTDSQFATKKYVDDNVSGGIVSNDRLIVAGTAGETMSTSTLVYFDGSDQKWKKVDTDTSSTYVDKFIGLTQGPGTNGTAISGGVLLKGRDSLVTGLSAGSTYYASASAGAISSTVSVQPIGIAEDTNVLYFDPVVIDIVRTGYENTFSATNTFSGAAIFSESITGHASTTYTVYTVSTTWTKPSNFEYIIVETLGGGGGGGSNGNTGVAASGGGGGGGYSKELLNADDLSATSTINITVGSGGTAGNTGGTSAFGNFLQATGGAGVSSGVAVGGNGGVGSGGDLNIGGEDGETIVSSAGRSGYGGSSFYGGGSKGVTGETAGINGNSYGSGGSGASSDTTGTTNGGTGADGIVIVTVYY